MSSSRWLQLWPRRCTTPHEDRRRRGRGGRRRASCTKRTRTGRLLLPSGCSSTCTKRSPAENGLPAWQSRRGRRSGYIDTMEQLADVAPMVPSLAAPEPQMVDQLVAMIKQVDSVVPKQIIAVPNISWPSRFPRTVLREPQKAAQLVEVPVPASSFSDLVRWEEI